MRHHPHRLSAFVYTMRPSPARYRAFRTLVPRRLDRIRECADRCPAGNRDDRSDRGASSTRTTRRVRRGSSERRVSMRGGDRAIRDRLVTVESRTMSRRVSRSHPRGERSSHARVVPVIDELPRGGDVDRGRGIRGDRQSDDPERGGGRSVGPSRSPILPAAYDTPSRSCRTSSACVRRLSRSNARCA